MAKEEKPTIISKQTLLPIGLILSLIGGVVWLTTIWGTANQALKLSEENAVRISELQISVQKNNEEVIDRMASVEAKLDFLIAEFRK